MIEVRDLHKTFRTQRRFPGFGGAIKGLFTREYTETRAVDGISFSIGDAEIVGYIGANGAGKSTTIKMMTGILTPSSGRILVDGLVPSERRRENAARIGVVFGQRTQLWWDLPLSESFSLLKDIYGVSDDDYAARMDFLDGVLGFREFFLSPVRTLSLGQRMRADLAAALIHQPRILYLDEPTIGLDIVVKDRVRKAIRHINREYGTTIILTTHDLDDIEELCSRILVIDSGKIVWDGSIEELRERFGYMRELRLRLAALEGGKEGGIAERLEARLAPLDPASRVTLADEELVVDFDRRALGIAALMREVMSICEVLDYSIRETKIDDIVKLIYAGKIRQ